MENKGEELVSELNDSFERWRKTRVIPNRELKRFLVKLWFYLSDSKLAAGDQVELSWRKILERFEAFSSHLQFIGRSERRPLVGKSDLPITAELVAVAMAFDRRLGGDDDFGVPLSRYKHTGDAEKIEINYLGIANAWLIPRPARLPETLPSVGQLHLPHAAIRRHRVVPEVNDAGIVFQVFSMGQDAAKRAFIKKLQKETLRAFAGVFTDNVTVDVQIDDRECHFHVIGLQGGDAMKLRTKTAKRLINEALSQDRKANVIVLPEMTLPPALQAKWIKALAKKMATQITNWR